MKKQVSNEMEYTPKISLIVPVYDTDVIWLERMIRSIEIQKYPHWELCICDNGSTKIETKNFLSQISHRDERFKIVFSEHNEGISIGTNKALKLAAGDFVALIDSDDELSSDALFDVVDVIKHEDVDVIYTDEDKITEDNRHFDPAFKPGWSPDLLLSCMYMNHLTVYRRKIIEDVGGFRKEFDGSQDHDLALRVTELTNKIFHIPKILYHWRAIPSSSAFLSSGVSAHIAGLKAVDAAIKRRRKGHAEAISDYKGYYRARYEIKGNPLVTIIIPTHDKVELLRDCIDSIEKQSTYSNYEIIVMDDQSKQKKTADYLSTLKHKVIRYDNPFNFALINNLAAKEAKGEYLIFLNNDTKVISNDWIESMLEHSQRKEVGAVGAKLIYPNDKVQHAGVLIGVGSICSHAFQGFPSHSFGYMGLLQVIHNCSAVTAACMMIKKSVFEEIGGFDEKLAGQFNDIDLCLRLRKKNFLIVFTPYSVLYHIGSATVGMSSHPEERSYFLSKWESLVKGHDPYYNPNLNHEKPDYAIRKDLSNQYHFTWTSPIDRSSTDTIANIRRYYWFATNIAQSHGIRRLIVEFLRFIKINLKHRLE